MSFFGMGALEILVIALVAFILLGPQKMIDAARLMGKATKEVRRMTDELPKIVLDEEQGQPTQTTPPSASSQGDQQARSGGEESDDGGAVGDGPVAFRSARTSTDEDKSIHTQGQDT